MMCYCLNVQLQGQRVKQLSFTEVTSYTARTPTALVETTLIRDRFSHKLYVQMARVLTVNPL